MKEKNNGITLIAVIITIIFLLILAGISIMQLKNNGLFEKAQLAKEESEKAQVNENKNLEDYEDKIDEYINGTRNDGVTEAITQISLALKDIGIETDSNETIASLSEKIKNIKTTTVTKLTVNGTGVNYSNNYYFYITDYDNYRDLTIDNISVQLNTSPFRATQQSDACGVLKYSYSYNSETGCIDVTLDGSMSHQSWGDPGPSATITIIQ